MRNRLACVALLLLSCGPGHRVLADQASGSSVPISFKLIRNFLIVVPVLIDGAGPYDFVLDTGTNTTLLHPEFARRLGLRPVDRMLLVTVTGSEAVPRSRLGRVALGPRSTADVEVLWTELREVRALYPSACGILGQNVLSRFNYLIDYQRQRIVLEQGCELERRLRGTRLPLENEEEQALIAPPAHAPLRFALDSGASSLVLFEKGARRLAPAGWLPVLRLGGETLRDLKVAIVLGGGERVEDGLLPLSLFRAVYFNHRAGYVILNPR